MVLPAQFSGGSCAQSGSLVVAGSAGGVAGLGLDRMEDVDWVETVDGELLAPEEARRACKRYFVVGFFALPLFWAVNIWLFLPHLLHAGGDPVVKRLCRLSAIWFAVYTAVFLPWTLTYLIGAP